jgi:c-di-GMP-binding flagellar brake protein YcgR
MLKKMKVPSLRVKLKIDSSSKTYIGIITKEIETKALDISVSGIGLLSRFFLPKATVVCLELKIKNKIIKIRGEIRSAISITKNLTRLGIKFIDLDNSKLKIIERFIKENEKRHPTRFKFQKRINI